jgi:hypothetical protein
MVDYVRPSHNREQRRAEVWLFEDGEGILTFEWACDVAGISLHTVRRVAEQLEENPEKARTNLRADFDL